MRLRYRFDDGVYEVYVSRNGIPGRFMGFMRLMLVELLLYIF
jgi:hypothetical protein